MPSCLYGVAESSGTVVPNTHKSPASLSCAEKWHLAQSAANLLPALPILTAGFHSKTFSRPSCHTP